MTRRKVINIETRNIKEPKSRKCKHIPIHIHIRIPQACIRRERGRQAGDVMELETGRQSTGKVVPG